MENMENLGLWIESMRKWSRRKETLGVFCKYAKRHKSVYNTNFKTSYILSIYTICDGLRQKHILSL